MKAGIPCGHSPLRIMHQLITLFIGSEEKNYTYTIITTSSNKQLNFLHDRMPVILDNGSEELGTWLDPGRSTWSKELQNLLKPYAGELEVYTVSKEVGKVGNNSPNFIIPVASSENKSNIANFFAKGTSKDATPSSHKLKKEDSIMQEGEEELETVDHEGTEDNAPLPVPKKEKEKGIKRELDDLTEDEPPSKIAKMSTSPGKSMSKIRSPTTNIKQSPKKGVTKEKGTQKITSFFNK